MFGDTYSCRRRVSRLHYESLHRRPWSRCRTSRCRHVSRRHYESHRRLFASSHLVASSPCISSSHLLLSAPLLFYTLVRLPTDDLPDAASLPQVGSKPLRLFDTPIFPFLVMREAQPTDWERCWPVDMTFRKGVPVSVVNCVDNAYTGWIDMGSIRPS